MVGTGASGGGTFAADLPSTIGSVEAARIALNDYLAPFGIGAAVRNRIEVILEELVSNVARHAKAAGTLRIEAGVRSNAVLLCVIDDGEAFNPLEQDDPAAFDRLENATLGGLGIPLLKRLTKTARYERSGGCNRVQVSFERS